MKFHGMEISWVDGHDDILPWFRLRDGWAFGWKKRWLTKEYWESITEAMYGYSGAQFVIKHYDELLALYKSELLKHSL